MKIIRDYHEFRMRVDILLLDDFFELDIVPTTEIGFFSKCRFTELKKFCEEDPHYHIVTISNHLLELNRPIENQNLYMLGAGDNDPEIVFMQKKYRKYRKK